MAKGQAWRRTKWRITWRPQYVIREVEKVMAAKMAEILKEKKKYEAKFRRYNRVSYAISYIVTTNSSCVVGRKARARWRPVWVKERRDAYVTRYKQAWRKSGESAHGNSPTTGEPGIRLVVGRVCTATAPPRASRGSGERQWHTQSCLSFHNERSYESFDKISGSRTFLEQRIVTAISECGLRVHRR